MLLVDSNRRSRAVREEEALVEFWDDPRVRLLEPNPPPQNSASARNAGLDAARGSWIAYLDDDDEYMPGKLAAQLTAALTENASLVLCGYTFVWPSGRRRVRQCQQSMFRDDELLWGAEFITSMLFHRADPQWRFDARSSAGDDRIVTLHHILRHRVKSVPNVAQCLVTMHSQTESVQKHREVAWWGCREALRVARHGSFSAQARRQFLLHGSMVRAANGFGSTWRLLGLMSEWFRTEGWGSWRFLGYVLLQRIHSPPSSSRS